MGPANLAIGAREGVTPADRHFAQQLRRAGTPVVLVANKAEGRAASGGVAEAYALGLGDPVALSAQHGEGLAELYERLLPFAAEPGESGDSPAPGPAPERLRLAIVGRPNVGKSTLVNRLLGEERVLTGPEPGITRDAIAVDWAWKGRPVRIFDTAGMRRRSHVEGRLERLSVADTRRAIRYAETVVLVLDGLQLLERQDLTIANLVAEEGRAIVLAVNKWDRVADMRAALARLRDRLAISLPQLGGVAAIPVSALSGFGLDALMKGVFAAAAVWNRRVPTGALNRWLAAIEERHPPPIVGAQRLRLRYMTQVNTRPPTFALFASKPGELPESYRRYLVNALRGDFALPGTPIRIMLRKGDNPYARG